MNTEEVIVQTTEEPCMRVYNVKYELTEKAAEDGCRGRVDELGSFGQLLCQIRGIEVVRVQPYRFFVSKAVMFSWDEIQPHILDLLQSLTASQKLLVENLDEVPRKNN